MLELQPDEVNDHLAKHVYARICRSPLGGVGVFAIRDIPRGIDPFNERDLDLKFIKVPAEQIENDSRIPEGVKCYVRDISSKREGIRNVPAAGYNSITTGFFMNHSPEPNVAYDAEGFARTLREIREGEELTLNYRAFNDESELEFEIVVATPLQPAAE
jgi:hypothetical protein